MLTVATLFAQAPQKMSYQAVVRNANNTLVTNQNVSAKISIIQGSMYGTPVYVETHGATTNANGLLTIEVGEGTVLSGTMAAINWANGPFYLKSEIDPTGGNSYTIEGVQELMSVPYALYASAAGNVPAIAIAPVDTGYMLTITYPGGQPQSFFLANGTPGPQGPAGPQGDPGQPGQPGQDGRSITSITGPVTNGLVDTYTIHFSDNTSTNFTVTNGAAGAPGQPGAPGQNGRGIVNITGPVTSGLVDTYTINYSDNTTSTFTVTNGADGQGGQGVDQTLSLVGTILTISGAGGNSVDLSSIAGSGSGQPGADGADGVGIDSIAKTNTVGNVDTYTIYYSNNTTYTYNVTNGVDGSDGADGAPGTPGAPGFSPTISVTQGPAGMVLTITDVTGTNQYIIPNGGGSGSGGTLVQQQVNWAETDPSAVTYILNKPNLAAVATSGSYNDLANKPDLSNYLTTETDPTVSNATITIQKNGTAVDNFTLNQSGNKTINITVPTQTSELTNNSGFITNAQVPTLNVQQTGTGYVLTVTQPGGSSQSYTLNNGAPGNDGNDGKGIASIAKTNTVGNVDTYTITYTDNTTFTYNVTNGVNGTNGVSPTVNFQTAGDNLIVTVTDVNGTSSTTIPLTTGGGGSTQVPADWNATSGVSMIINKPTNVSEFNNDAGYLTSESDPTVNNSTITIQKNGTTVDNFTLNQNTNKTINITVPTQTSELTNNSGFLTTETDPTVNNATITIQKNGSPVDAFTANQSSDKNINILVPTKTSDLTNDNGFITSYTETDPTVNNSTITIQKNGTEVDHFTANQSSDKTINITVPTQTSELTNNSGFITAADVPAQVNADWNATSGAAQIMNKPAVSELQIQSISNDTIYFTNSTYAVMTAQWNNILNKPDFAVVAYSNDYNDLSNKPTALSEFTDDMGYITSADIPAQQQANWNEEDATSPAYIHNKPDMNDYAGVDTLDNFVTKTENETVGGDKTFTGFTTFEGTWSDFYSQAEFYDDVYFDEWVGFYEDVVFNDVVSFNHNVNVSNSSGRITVPSVLDNIETDGTLVVEDNFDENNCHNAVNFCDLQTVYDDIQNKMQTKLNELTNAFNDQVDDLLDSIAKLNDKLNTPKDGEACPNNPTVTDYDGNTYATVRIGNQCWMRENLRVLHWPNGTAVTNYSTPDVGASVCGYLYAFTEVMANNSATATSAATQGICPYGWRVPGDADFTELVAYATVKTGNASRSLKAGYGWTGSNVGDNTLGMSIISFKESSDYADYYTTNKTDWYIHGDYDLYAYGTSSNKWAVRCIRANNNGEANTVNAPTVVTFEPSEAISELTQTSAYIKAGKIVNDGGMPVTKYGYVRSTTAGTFNDASLRIGKANTQPTEWTTSPSSYPYTMPSGSPTNLTSNTRYYYRAFAINAIDTAYGAVKYFTTESNEKACPGLENITDVSGYSYPTVKIGNQCWMARNLRTTKYADNSNISGYYSPNNASVNANYGRLYAYAAAMRGTYYHTGSGNVQGACPSGWHVPSPAEFETMKTTMQGTTDYQCNSTAINIAKALASKSGWTTSSDACAVGNGLSSNNASGFNAFPAGYLSISGSVQNSYGTEARFYTTELGTLYRLHYNLATMTTYTPYTPENFAYSLRCVQGSNYVPSVKTGTSSSVSVETASLSGTVASAGSSSVTQRGICFSTSDNPTTSNTTVTASDADFTVDLTNLAANTTYYYRAYAINSYGTAYGEVKSFTTLSGDKVSNSGVGIITKTSARFLGNIVTGAASETVQQWGFFLYKKQSNGTFTQVADAYSNGTSSFTTSSGYTCQLTSTPQSGYYAMDISGLDPGTSYKYKAEIRTNLQGWVYASSESEEFVTLMDPAVTTVSATYPGNGNSIVMKGNITNVGIPAYTEKGFLVGQSTDPTYDNNYNKRTVSGTSAGEFTLTWDNWTTPNKTWYIRAYVKNSSGVFYGSTITYTTPDKPSIQFVSNFEAPYNYSANVTRYSIKLQTSASSHGSSLTERGLLYTTNQSMSENTPTSSNTSTNASDAGSKWVKVASASPSTQTINISGLSSNTVYYIKSYATNAYGTGYSTVTKKVKTQLNCGATLTDQDDKTYNTVKIGSQCWMKENSRAFSYDNMSVFGGNPIVTIELKTGTGTTSLTTPYRYNPNNNNSLVTNYGWLFNWAAATGYSVTNYPQGDNMLTSQGKHQGICPRGWHIPTQTELNTLANNLGTTSNLSNFNYNQFAGWLDYHNGAPRYDEFGQYLELRGYSTNPSTSNEAAGMYISSSLSVDGDNYYIDKRSGASVRCVQDISY